MKKWIALLIAAVVAYGVYDLIREVRSAYTSEYTRTYSHALGLMMSPRFDTLRLSGRGIRIGVLDAGFGGLRSARWTRELQVGGFRDFTGGDSAAFFEDPTDHGTQVCANVGGRSGDTLRGLAYGSTYFLAKTDRAEVEPRAEEQAMIRGIEWLLEQEVDIITSSLAYTIFDDFEGYTPAMLDGRTSVLSRYLDSLLAARPELIFLQSAGNDGDEKWKYTCFPADVQAVITVGATDFEGTGRYHTSSLGYEGAAYIKPDFALYASPIGTSFSTPVLTGFCACLLEHRRLSRDSLTTVLRASATQAASPDRELGYGMPQSDAVLKLLTR